MTMYRLEGTALAVGEEGKEGVVTGQTMADTVPSIGLLIKLITD